MASWTDKKPEFNPYIAQKPVDAMVKVGMQKQAQYDQGYQKIQNSIDNIAGLDIMRDKDKAHLQSKLTQLGSKLQYVAAGDFSNFQLSASVSGMANDLIRDPGIQGSVASTQRYKKQAAIVDAAKKDGTLTPDNQYNFDKQVNAYLNDEEIGANFTGEYKPYFDVFKFVKETFDEVKPGEYTFDQIYQLDANGDPRLDEQNRPILSPWMTRLEKEGRLPEVVQQTMSQIFSDPRVSQQLNITGEYNYRGTSSEQLVTDLNSQRDQLVSALDEKILTETAKLNSGVDVQESLDNLKMNKANTLERYNTWAEQAITNPDAIKGAMYQGQVASKYTAMFGQQNTKSTIHASPAADYEWKIQKEANVQSRWAQTFQHTKDQDLLKDKRWQADFDQGVLQWEADYALDDWKAKNATTKDGKTTINKDGLVGPGLNKPTDDFIKTDDVDVVMQQAAEYGIALDNRNNSVNELIWGTQLKSNPVLVEKLNSRDLLGESRDTALDAVINEHAIATVSDDVAQTPQDKIAWFKKNGLKVGITTNNNLTEQERQESPDSQHLIKNYNTANRHFSAENDRNETIQNEVLKDFDNMAEDEVLKNIKPTTILFEDKEYNLEKQDIVDIALIRRAGHQYLGPLGNKTAMAAAKRAEKRLEARGMLPMITAIRRDQASDDVWEGDPSAIPTGIARYVFDTNPIADIYRSIRYKSERNFENNPRDWSEVDKVHDVISNDKSLARLKRRAEVINQVSIMAPPQQVSLLGKVTADNTETITKLGNLAGNYNVNDFNLSPNFDAFRENINNALANKYSVGAGITKDAEGNNVVEIRLYGNKNESMGSMTVTEPEAVSLGVAVAELYDTPEVRSVRLSLKTNGGQTSKANIKETATYVNNDVYFNKQDLGGLKGYSGDVKVNFQTIDGMNFPVVYIQAQGVEIIKTLDGSPNLGQTVRAIQDRLNPALINKYITEYKARENAKQEQANQ